MGIRVATASHDGFPAECCNSITIALRIAHTGMTGYDGTADGTASLTNPHESSCPGRPKAETRASTCRNESAARRGRDEISSCKMGMALPPLHEARTICVSNNLTAEISRDGAEMIALR
jgi:hypothetical protein